MTGYKIPFIGLNRQYNNLKQEILDVTDTVLSSGQLMDGSNTTKFEQWLAVKNHSKYAVTCHSGTQALEIIAEWEFGTQGTSAPIAVIPTLTYPATANAFITAGFNVKLVDIDRYGLIDMNKIKEIPEMFIDIIVPVGLYGHSLKDKFTGWAVDTMIEDGAQHWLADNCNRIARNTAISFDPTKNLANYGNGGAVVTNNKEFADFARSYRNNGKSDHSYAGTNSRMSEVDCAQMLVKTEYIDAWQSRRAKICRYWIDKLKGTKIRTLIDDTNFYDHAYHKFVIEVDDRDDIISRLAIAGIETKVHYYKPLHEYACYQPLMDDGFLSVASSLCRRVLSLPLYPELTDTEVEYIINQLLASV